MSEQFFKDLDARIAAAKAIAAGSGNKPFPQATMGRLKSRCQVYASALVSHGIPSEMVGSDTQVYFSLRWKDGQILNLDFTWSEREEKILLYKRAQSGTGHSDELRGVWPEFEWRDSYFDTEIEELINTFIVESPKHGGLENLI